MKECIAMICGTAVVIAALALDGAVAQAMAAAFVAAGGFLTGVVTQKIVSVKKEAET